LTSDRSSTGGESSAVSEEALLHPKLQANAAGDGRTLQKKGVPSWFDSTSSIGGEDVVIKPGVSIQLKQLAQENAEVSSKMEKLYERAVCLGTHEDTGWLILADPDTGKRFYADPATKEISWGIPTINTSSVFDEAGVVRKNNSPGDPALRFGMPPNSMSMWSQSQMDSLLDLGEESYSSINRIKKPQSPEMTPFDNPSPVHLSKIGRRHQLFKCTSVQILCDPPPAALDPAVVQSYAKQAKEEEGSAEAHDHAQIPPPAVFRYMLESISQLPGSNSPGRKRPVLRKLDANKSNGKSKTPHSIQKPQNKGIFVCPPGGWKEAMPLFGPYLTYRQRSREQMKEMIKNEKQKFKLQLLQEGASGTRERHAKMVDSRNTLTKILESFSTHLQLKSNSENTLRTEYTKELLQFQMLSTGLSQVYHCRQDRACPVPSDSFPSEGKRLKPKLKASDDLVRDVNGLTAIEAEKLQTRQILKFVDAKKYSRRAHKKVSVPEEFALEQKKKNEIYMAGELCCVSREIALLSNRLNVSLTPCIIPLSTQLS